MTESIYKEYENKYYNPNDNDKKPGDNDNWKSIQEGFHRIGTTQLETSEGLTLGKGTADETSVTAGELEEIKNPTQLETSGGLTLGKGTADEVSVTAAELGEMKSASPFSFKISKYSEFNVSGGVSVGNNIYNNDFRMTGLKSDTDYLFLINFYGAVPVSGGATPIPTVSVVPTAAVSNTAGKMIVHTTQSGAISFNKEFNIISNMAYSGTFKLYYEMVAIALS